jgi:hypothetical protein
MSLSTIAKRLAHRFVRLYAFFRKELHTLREVRHAMNVAESRSAAESHRIAVHEAGHAVLQIALGLDCHLVSICPVPSEGLAGFTLSRGVPTQASRETADASAAQSAEHRALYLRDAMVSYAGAEAVRQLIPTDPDPDQGASCDEEDAAKTIAEAIGSGDVSARLLFALARRRCAVLVTHYEPEIRAIAGQLEAKHVLFGRSVRKVFRRSLKARSGRLLTFKTDPILHGLDSDEAFQAFLRRVRLPAKH